jgi:hypothetical protein
MSSYPPNTPPPAGGPQPPYDPYAWRNQQRLLKDQRKLYAQQQKQAWRVQREQIKAQQRAMRRGSIIGPILLVVMGVVFLLTQTGKISWGSMFAWYGTWWPAILIAIGVALLLEWGVSRQRNGVGGPVLGGGVLVLLMFLAVIGVVTTNINRHTNWANQLNSDGWMQMMGENHEFDNDIDSAIGDGETLVVNNPHGDVTVTGSSPDNQVHVSVHSKIRAWKESDAEEKSRELMPVFAHNGSQLSLSLGSNSGVTTDLEITLPHDSALTVQAGRGDVSASEIHAPVTLNVNHGNIELNAISGNVSLHTDYDDATVTGHSITGEVALDGRAGDMTFSDVSGGVSLNGDFFGSTHLERVNGVVRFQTSRTQFQAARLDGEFDTSGGSELEAHEVLGPVTLTTHDRNITLDRVEGRVQISNRNGSVDVTTSAPLGGVQIVNHKGSVNVGLPENAGFVVDAATHNGDLENDFGLENKGSHDNPMIKGTVSGGGPVVSIATTEGDVTLRKTTVAPLAPLAPLPKISVTPPVPAKPVSSLKAPAAPKAPRAPKAATPATPAKPAAPATPSTPAAPGGMA